MFSFRQFDIDDARCGMKVGTDGVLLGAWACCDGAVSVLDAGCGSGLIALMLAQRNDRACIIGVESDSGACLDAMGNVEKSPWADRVEIRCGDVLDFDRSSLQSPLLVVSNPPFFSESLHSPEPGRSLARHGEGFDVMTLISLAGRLLREPSDSLAFIAPAARIDEIEFRLALERLDVRRRATVFSREGRKPVRVLYQVGRGAGNVTEEEKIAIRDTANQLTMQYKSLTSEFYLDR